MDIRNLNGDIEVTIFFLKQKREIVSVGPDIKSTRDHFDFLAKVVGLTFRSKIANV